jgi:hypothetical protein
MNNERLPSINSVYIGTQASGASIVLPGIFFRKRSRIKNVYLVDQAGLSATGDTTDYFTLTLQDNSATPVAYAVVTTSGSAVVVNTQFPTAGGTLKVGGGLAFDTQPAGADNSGPTATTGGLDADQVGGSEVDVPAGTMLNLNVVGTASAQHKVLTNAIFLVESYPL